MASDKSIYKEFITEKYRATKSKMASWKLSHYTQKGRTMIANTLVSSRLRYWAQFMLIPRSINKSLDADIQALIWNKEIKFDADEDGTEKVNRRFMMKGAEHNSTQELGLGLLHWPSHSEALLAKAALSYRDATTSDWKLIIDQWIAKGRSEQRGAIFTTDPEKFKHRGKRLSPFWRKAFKTLGKLKLELIEEKQITTETARAEPIWEGHLIDMTPSMIKKKDVWKNILQLNKVGDTVRTDGTPWTKEEVQAQIQESLERGWNGLATIRRCRKNTQISLDTNTVTSIHMVTKSAQLRWTHLSGDVHV